MAAMLLFIFVRPDFSATINDTTTPANSITTPTSIPTPTIDPVGVPQQLIIPSLNIDVEIESLGDDEEGHMATPTDWYHTAWYNRGPRPGAPGTSVIAGHYDTNTGAPAAFYYLSRMQPGDTFYVRDNTGIIRTFIVTDMRQYAYADVPVDQVFDDPSGRKLNLITCGGTWNPLIHNYSDRLIVYATLQPQI